MTGVTVTMAEALPPRVRCTSMSVGYNPCVGLFFLKPVASSRTPQMSVSYNLCVGLLGGTTPMIATYLIKRSGNDLAPAFFLMAAAAISLATVMTLRETVDAPVE